MKILKIVESLAAEPLKILEIVESLAAEPLLWHHPQTSHAIFNKTYKKLVLLLSSVSSEKRQQIKPKIAFHKKRQLKFRYDSVRSVNQVSVRSDNNRNRHKNQIANS